MPKQKLKLPKDWKDAEIIEISPTSCVAIYRSEYRGEDGITVQRGWAKNGDDSWSHGKRMFFPDAVAEEMVAIINGFLGE